MDRKPVVNTEYKYSDITSRIVNSAMKVHRTMGNGFQEVIYQRCLKVEMERQHLEFVREQEIPIFYTVIGFGQQRTEAAREKYTRMSGVLPAP